MIQLTDEELIRKRIKHPAKDQQLKKDYNKFGNEGNEIIKWIKYFDQADIHDPSVYNKINEFFHYIKLITPYFCCAEDKVQLLQNIAEEKKWITVKFSDNSIIDENPIFIPSSHNQESIQINPETHEQLLDEIVYKTRCMLSEPNHNLEKIIGFNLANRCEEASRYIKQLASEYHLNTQIVKISAAFSEDEPLYDCDMEYHYIVLIEIDNKTYIVDCTYAQFFSWYRNEIERLGNYCYIGCFPGIYMIKDKERERVARTILKRGWIELTEENGKHYFDGFALSYRNGLFYENLGVADYSTPYTIEDYHNFLFGDDSQLKREGRKYLGYQMEQLKKSDFKF